jgi:hypothetical protein
MAKLTKEQKQKQLLKWAKKAIKWHTENKEEIDLMVAVTGIPKPPPLPPPG